MELSFLQILWFILIIVLWIGYVTLEGFGFGTGMLLKILPRNEKERRLQLNTIGPHWDGNEVFLLTAGGATFAAFPEWYATMFSGMYLALVLVLVLLIVRISAIEWRGKIDSDKWRAAWDTLHTGSAWLVALVWGVAFGNLVQGMAIQVGNYEVAGDPASFVAADPSQVDAALQAGAQHFLTGGFFSLFTPFTIVAGLVVVSLFLTHGALWLALKTTGDFSARAKILQRRPPRLHRPHRRLGTVGILRLLHNMVCSDPARTSRYRFTSLHFRYPQRQRESRILCQYGCCCLRRRLHLYDHRAIRTKVFNR